MCTECSNGNLGHDLTRPLLNRRMAIAGTIAGAIAGPAVLGPANASAATGPPSTPAQSGIELVLLGTRSGPPIEPRRKGIASALVVDGSTYVIDCGRSATSQYVEAGLKLSSLRGIFITHLHHDHVADYFNFFLLGGNLGNSLGDSLPAQVNVYGPGSAGGLPPAAGGSQPPLINPANPTPGLLDLTNYSMDAHAYSSNIFMLGGAVGDLRSRVNVHELALPSVGASYQNTAPLMQPFLVMEDDKVKVTAILVPHGAVFPSFAFRFDTDYGSVTFSGDTTYTPNIPTLARGSDILVHEALNIEGATLPPAFANGVRTTHVEVQKVGPIAQAADVPRLVLSHIGDLAEDPINEGKWRQWAQAGYDGTVTVGQDLQRFVRRGRQFVSRPG